MLSPEELNPTLDDVSRDEPHTDSLERVPRSFDHRSALAERRQQILQQKVAEQRTDALPAPAVTLEPSGTKSAWRQVMQLREENRRLRFELEEVRGERERLVSAYNRIQTELDSDVAAVHTSYLQDIEQTQAQMREIIEERNRLRDAKQTVEVQYQDLSQSFQEAVEQEAYKLVKEATQALEVSPDEAPVLLHDTVKTLELRAQQLEDKHMVETLYLKREVQRLAELLRKEQQQIEQERQNLIVMQYTVREQSELRRKTLQAHLYARWRASFVFVALSLLAVMIVLQFISLALFHVGMGIFTSIALIAPIIVCGILALVLSQPISMMRHIYESAPHKKKVKKN